MASWNPFAMFGRFSRSDRHFGRRVAAIRAANVSGNGSDPNRLRIAFFGEVGGNVHVVDAATARKLWGHHPGPAIGDDVITGGAESVKDLVEAVGCGYSLWLAHGRNRRAGHRARPSKTVTTDLERFPLGQTAGSGRIAATRWFMSGLLSAPHPSFTTGRRE